MRNTAEAIIKPDRRGVRMRRNFWFSSLLFGIILVVLIILDIQIWQLDDLLGYSHDYSMLLRNGVLLLQGLTVSYRLFSASQNLLQFEKLRQAAARGELPSFPIYTYWRDFPRQESLPLVLRRRPPLSGTIAGLATLTIMQVALFIYVFGFQIGWWIGQSPYEIQVFIIIAESVIAPIALILVLAWFSLHQRIEATDEEIRVSHMGRTRRLYWGEIGLFAIQGTLTYELASKKRIARWRAYKPPEYRHSKTGLQVDRDLQIQDALLMLIARKTGLPLVDLPISSKALEWKPDKRFSLPGPFPPVMIKQDEGLNFSDNQKPRAGAL